MAQQTIGLVGNPNCGKTTLFNTLTGANQHVGNWPGVTVERKEGSYRAHGQQITVVDLPGVYSVDAEDTTTGLDELVARDYLLSGEADVIINIIDASNLERNLYLTTQILEMGVPIIVALNMMDLAQDREIRIHPKLLSDRLDCPVIPLCAHTGKGVSQLKDAINHALVHPTISKTYVAYPPVIEEALADLIPTLESQSVGTLANVRWFALNLLQYDDRHLPNLGQDTLRRIAEHRHRIHQTLGEDTDLLIADSRYTWIHQMIQGVMERTHVVQQTVSDRLDRLVLNRWLGIPIFLAVMYLMFFVSINVGGAFIDFFDIGGSRTGADQYTGLVDWFTGGWCWWRDSNHGHVYSAHCLPVCLPGDSGRFGIPGPCRLCDGSADAVYGASRQILRADDGRLRLQHPRHYGHPDVGKSARSPHDHSHESVHVLRCPSPGVCPVRRRLLPDQWAEHRLYALHPGHSGRRFHGRLAEAHPVPG